MSDDSTQRADALPMQRRNAMAGHPSQSFGYRAYVVGLVAFLAMLGVYFGALTLVSGWSFTIEQFYGFWYYVLALAAGFGFQVGLFVRLRELLAHSSQTQAVLAASGTTSTAAMVSCCAHYLANVAPILGATGLVAFAAQFQVQLFWVGLLFNLAGIAYTSHKLLNALRDHQHA